MQKLRYIDPDSKETKIASFAHIKEIYENEKNLTVKATNIDFTTIYPTNVDKQKVRLCMNVFNENVVVQLEMNGRTETARFVQLVSRMNKILNITTPDMERRLRDPDRA